MPSIVSGPAGSPVLVDGSFWVPATAAGAAVGTAATGAAVGAVVGPTLEAAVAIGVAVAAGAGVKVVIGAGTGVGLAEGATVNGGRVGGMRSGADAQLDVRKWSLSKVTLPFLASALPLTVMLSPSVTDVRAMIVPTKVEPVPRVAELVTCQKMLQGLAPLM